MSGLWNEYDRDEVHTLNRGNSGTRYSTRDDAFRSDVLNLQGTDVDAIPMFEREVLAFKETASIVKVTTANNVIVIGLLSNKVKRYYVGTPELDDVLDIPCTVGEKKIYNLFLDPTGKHLIISMTSGELFYALTGKTTLKDCSKLMCNTIEAVGWNMCYQSDVDTRDILLGNTFGIVFETKLALSFDRGTTETCRKLFNTDEGESITGLMFFHENNDPSLRTAVVVATPSRLYEFYGHLGSSEGSKFLSIFNNDELASFKTDKQAEGQFKIFYEKYPEPKSLLWLTATGGHYYKVSNTTDAFNERSILFDQTLISVNEKGIPLDIVLSQFHVFILLDYGFEVKSLINSKCIHQEPLRSPTGNFLGFSADPTIRNKIFAYAKDKLVKIKISNEERDVWRFYMELNKFEQADLYAKGDQNKIFEITSKEGDYYFELGLYSEAANCYASSNRSFEEITLKFIKNSTDDGLMDFLQKKLESLPNTSPTQICMLVVWIIEIFISEINLLEKQSKLSTAEQELLQTRRESLKTFLKNDIVFKNIKKNAAMVKVIQDLMASYGDSTDLIFFADLMDDTENVILQHINSQNYTAALSTLRNKRHYDLFYKYTPILIKHIPEKTVTVLQQFTKYLEPLKLLPAFVSLKSKEECACILEYLKFLILKTKCQDVAIHNLLLSLLVQEDDEPSILSFLKDYANFDLKYALRICTQHKKWQACCFIYSKLLLYEEGVKLALSKLNDIELATQTAMEAQENVDDPDVIKKLWLLIARHVVKKGDNIKKVMEFIDQGDRIHNILKIEDVLPFFKDFYCIDDFKDAICKSLESYNQDINRINLEMKEARDSAERIHNDVKKLKAKNCVVETSKMCSLCEVTLLSKSFYVFPCSHMIHTTCLIQEIRNYLRPRRQEEVDQLHKTMVSLKANNATGGEKYREVKARLNDIIAEECILCGKYMIQSIDMPFVTEDPEEFEKLKLTWS